MPLSERTNRPAETTSNSITSVEHFLRVGGGGGGDSGRMGSPTSSSPTSPYFERLKQQDTEEEQGLYQKKSVLTKMKEKAKKFRNSLNKKRQDDYNFTPSWGNLEDDEEEQDAEYLGAPMYESEMAPQRYKENARQHPRANPVISEKRVLPTNVKHDGENKTMTETITEKITPIFGGGSDGTNSASSKINIVPTTPYANMSSQTSSIVPPMQNSSSVSLNRNNATSNQKGATGKEYFITKLKSKEDERTMSQPQTQVISEATPNSNNAGVMDKVKGAVNSLLGNEELSQQYATKTNVTPGSSQTQQVDQEENRGRILQAN